MNCPLAADQWHKAALPLLASPLVQGTRQQQQACCPHQAWQSTFTTILDLVATENQAYADLLRGRFWQGKQLAEMLTAECPLPMSKCTLSNYQRSADPDPYFPLFTARFS